MLKSRTLSVQDQSVHCVTGGDGPPLLFLHGWPTHSGLYRNVMPALNTHRRTIAIDLPGFGQSSKPTDVRYSFSFFNRVIHGVLDELAVDKVGLVVHDLGGPVGLHWATENHERVSELVVLNTLVFTEFHWMVKLFMAGVTLPGLSHALTSSYGIRGSMKFGMQTPSTREVLDLYSAPFQTRQDRAALALTGRHLSIKKLARTAEQLSRLKVPTLLMFGTKDRILPDVDKTMQRLHGLWPHATKIPLPDVGHFLQEDAPDTVAEHIARFVDRPEATFDRAV